MFKQVEKSILLQNTMHSTCEGKYKAYMASDRYRKTYKIINFWAMSFFESAISKIVASVATLQNETTFALSSLNPDFTLIKLEAPIEYKGVGASISSAWKHSAETGGLHKTAQKLGVLFESKIPLDPEHPIMFEEEDLVAADNWDGILTLEDPQS
ncbi:hypothetical protein EAF00_007932 [Botryotinia globosa]|nr:hypothetical protein EAF00_007932 [Botryotinia globosa]